MPRIRWYGPDKGKGSTGDRVSHTTPVVDAVKAKANEIGAKAAFLLDSRALHRTGDSQIHVKHHPTTYLDSWVYLKDPSDGPEEHGAAYGIELRHHVLRDALDSSS